MGWSSTTTGNGLRIPSAVSRPTFFATSRSSRACAMARTRIAVALIALMGCGEQSHLRGFDSVAPATAFDGRRDPARVDCQTGMQPGLLSDATLTDLLFTGCDAYVLEQGHRGWMPVVVAFLGEIELTEGLSRLMGGLAGRMSLLIVHPHNRLEASAACTSGLVDSVAVQVPEVREGWRVQDCHPQSALHWRPCFAEDTQSAICMSSAVGRVTAETETSRWNAASVRIEGPVSGPRSLETLPEGGLSARPRR